MFEYGIDSMITTVDRIESLDEAFESAASSCYSAAVRAFRAVVGGFARLSCLRFLSSRHTGLAFRARRRTLLRRALRGFG